MKTLVMNRRTRNSKAKPSLTGKARNCNICSRSFVPLTAFDRYCPSCKSGSELLKFFEWLPEIEPSVPWVQGKIAA